MKRMKMILGTMILAVGMVGAASAQPAPDRDHDRDDSRVYNPYRYDHDDAYRRGDRDDQYRVWRGDGDRDDYYATWNGRRYRDDYRVRRGDRDDRAAWGRAHSNIRRDRDDR